MSTNGLVSELVRRLSEAITMTPILTASKNKLLRNDSSVDNKKSQMNIGNGKSNKSSFSSAFLGSFERPDHISSISKSNNEGTYFFTTKDAFNWNKPSSFDVAWETPSNIGNKLH